MMRPLVTLALLFALTACPALPPDPPPPTDDDRDDDGHLAGADCDDTDPTIHPGADELCDGIDNDCDGAIDVDAIDAPEWWADTDGDGFGEATSPAASCDAPDGHVDDATDCDDDDASVHPGATELCDGVDNNCDGVADDLLPWYVDGDGDGHGAEGSDQVAACDAPDGHVATGLDCNDADPAIHPDATEVCDGIDNDCDSTSAAATFLPADGGLSEDWTEQLSAGTEASPAGLLLGDDGVLEVCEGAPFVTFAVTADVTVRGTGRDETALDGGDVAPLFDLTGFRSLRLESITLRRGHRPRGGAVHAFDGGTIEVVDAAVRDNVGTSDGGAIYLGQGALTIVGTEFVGNTTGGAGGAVFAYRTAVTIDGSTFVDNRADAEGGALAAGSGSGAPGPVVTITDSQFESNRSGQEGAITVQGGVGGALTLSGSTVDGSTGTGIFADEVDVSITDSTVSNSSGRGLYCHGCESLEVSDSAFLGQLEGGLKCPIYRACPITDTEFSGNDRTGDGAAVEGQNATITVTDCTFVGNDATAGGGAIYAQGSAGSVTVTGSTFDQNTALGGGAIKTETTATSIGGSLFTGNSAYGGGAVQTLSSNLTIDGSTFEGNDATYGGALSVSQQVHAVTGSSFDGNTAVEEGGAFWALANGNVQNCVFTNNVAGTAGGAMRVGLTDEVTIESTDFGAMPNDNAPDDVTTEAGSWSWGADVTTVCDATGCTQ